MVLTWRVRVEVRMRKRFLAQVWKCACVKDLSRKCASAHAENISRASVEVRMRKSFLAQVWKCACVKVFSRKCVSAHAQTFSRARVYVRRRKGKPKPRECVRSERA